MPLVDVNALVFVAMFPLGQIAASLSAVLAAAIFGGRHARAALCAYLVWLWLDRESPYRGGYRVWWLTTKLRSSIIWRTAARYFPQSLHATSPLPKETGPYVFVCHPHGIFGISPQTTFGTDATGFTKMFPGLQVHLLGHRAIFNIPFFREWCLLHGCGVVERRTCQALLRQGRCIVLAVGGAKESLECIPGTMRLYLQRRQGFARLALQTGAAVVPVLGFGENELYDTVQFERGTRCRTLQDALQASLGFALPLFRGRWWMPLLPKRRPVATVVGAPVRLEEAEGGPAAGRGLDGEPSPELVAKLHGKYCDALRALFVQHRAQHGCAGMELEII